MERRARAASDRRSWRSPGSIAGHRGGDVAPTAGRRGGGGRGGPTGGGCPARGAGGRSPSRGRTAGWRRRGTVAVGGGGRRRRPVRRRPAVPGTGRAAVEPVQGGARRRRPERRRRRAVPSARQRQRRRRCRGRGRRGGCRIRRRAARPRGQRAGATPTVPDVPRTRRTITMVIVPGCRTAPGRATEFSRRRRAHRHAARSCRARTGTRRRRRGSPACSTAPRRPTTRSPGAYHDHFGERLVELAGVGPGDAVLDVACGRGAVLVPAATRVGPVGRVVGVDLSPVMVRLAPRAASAPARRRGPRHGRGAPRRPRRLVRPGAVRVRRVLPARPRARRRRVPARAGARRHRRACRRGGPRTSAGRGRTSCSPTSRSSAGPSRRPFDEPDELAALLARRRLRRRRGADRAPRGAPRGRRRVVGVEVVLQPPRCARAAPAGAVAPAARRGVRRGSRRWTRRRPALRLEALVGLGRSVTP